MVTKTVAVKAKKSRPGRRRGGVNKSKVVREVLAAHPSLGPTEISTIVKDKHGLDVSVQLVSNIKSKVGGLFSKRPFGRPRSIDLTVTELVQVKEWADKLGGVDRAQKALATLARFQ